MRPIPTLVLLVLGCLTQVPMCGCAHDRGQPLNDPSQGGTTTITSADRDAPPHCSTGSMPNTSGDYDDCARGCNKLSDRAPEDIQCLSDRDACRTKCAAAFKSR